MKLYLSIIYYCIEKGIDTFVSIKTIHSFCNDLQGLTVFQKTLQQTSQSKVRIQINQVDKIKSKISAVREWLSRISFQTVLYRVAINRDVLDIQLMISGIWPAFKYQVTGPAGDIWSDTGYLQYLARYRISLQYPPI